MARPTLRSRDPSGEKAGGWRVRWMVVWVCIPFIAHLRHELRGSRDYGR